jgi:FkbM family methyltransferase
MLNRVFEQKLDGFYIDVGAMDPLEGSVTKTFYDRGWNGINIEPDARFHMKLVADRPRDINLNLAVGDVAEVRTLYSFEAQGLSTFSDHFRDYFVEHGNAAHEVPCKVTTLAEICRNHAVKTVDFLKIDAEGWEGHILRGADWVNFRAVILLIEATEPFSHTPAWQDWEPYLLHECGYVFVYFDGLNRYYVRQEDGELASRFAFPPNVLDGFQPYSVAEADRLAAEYRQLEAEAEELKAANASLQGELARLGKEVEALQKDLRDSRVWIGRLSEQLAAAKR